MMDNEKGFSQVSNLGKVFTVFPYSTWTKTIRKLENYPVRNHDTAESSSPRCVDGVKVVSTVVLRPSVTIRCPFSNQEIVSKPLREGLCYPNRSSLAASDRRPRQFRVKGI